ncbi:hypothetical protein CHS0354_016554 [Potamilus streckersoni]|uniref:Novel STAND NTPase 3 domain-containing protein n=1 Tax=Potamilus streckersoni TaxID=2493646 RepID=A0AAE0TLM0_9BIVA|nr:hypothetical protein CHS0354_016554 [Potamilus streckersoni]
MACQFLDKTEDLLSTFREMGFIPTSQTEEAKKLLQEKRSVVIKGNPGEGKTSTAFHLIDSDDYIHQRVVVSTPKQWKKVVTDWVKIVVLEDIFGQKDIDPGLLQEWINDCLQTIQKHVDVGKLQVIITIRNDIMLKISSKLKSFKLFSSDMSLTLSSEKLKHSDKMSILNRELERNNKDLNVDEKEKCIANFLGLFGFPQCCSLFAGNKDLFAKGPRFFSSPEKFFINNISNLEPNYFLSLAFLFCNHGEIEEEYLSPSQMQNSENYLQVLKELALCSGISFNKLTTMTSLRDSYDHFLGQYVKRVFSYEHHPGGNMSYEDSAGGQVSKSYIRFFHASVCEAVGKVLGDECPEMVVKYSDPEYLYQRTCITKAKDDSQNVFIPVSLYELLVERMVHDVVEERVVKSVVKHAALKQDEFLIKLKNKLQNCNKIRDFLMASQCSENSQNVSEGECITFLQYVLQSDNGTVRLVYNHFMEFMACSHNNNISDCWQCTEKQKLLELALYYHHFQIADKLISMNACYTHVSLCNAARHGDLSRVQAILEYIKKRQVFNPKCYEAKQALSRASVLGNHYLKEMLLEEGITQDNSDELSYPVKLQTSQTKRSDVTGEIKQQIEVIYQREAIPKDLHAPFQHR